MTGIATTNVAAAAQEQILRTKVREIVGDDPAKLYKDLDLSYTFRDALFIFLLLAIVVGGSCALFAWIGPVSILFSPLFAVLSGIAFNWINVQIHEASHGLLLRNRKLNDAYCNLAFGAWGLQDVETYRLTHGMHHAYLHTDKDPDLPVYSRFVGSLRAMTTGLARDLLLLSALGRNKQVRSFLRKNEMAAITPPFYTWIGKLTAQAIVVSIYIYFCGLWGIGLYAGGYLLGLLGVFPILIRIRTVVQHWGNEGTAPNRSPAYISRTTVAPVLEFLVVGARMDYHLEHHLFPSVPYYNLRKMHRRLGEAGLFDRGNAGDGLRTENYLKTYGHLATRKWR